MGNPLRLRVRKWMEWNGMIIREWKGMKWNAFRPRLGGDNGM